MVTFRVTFELRRVNVELDHAAKTLVAWHFAIKVNFTFVNVHYFFEAGSFLEVLSENALNENVWG